MRIACWITKATNTHSEYVILSRFTTAKMVARAHRNVTLYVHCIVLYSYLFQSKHRCKCSPAFPTLQFLLTNQSIPVTVLWPLCSLYFITLTFAPQNTSFCNNGPFYTFPFLMPAASAITALQGKAPDILSPFTLRYKPEGGGFDSRWCHCNFSLT